MSSKRSSRFGTTNPVIIYPASDTGAWEAALANTLSPGDKVLCFETGHLATLWREMADALGLVVDFVAGDRRHGVSPGQVAEKPEADTLHEIKAVCLPEDVDADHIRAVILDRFDMLLGTGLAKLAGKVFRIGHLGDFNDLMLVGTLGGVQMGLSLAGVSIKQDGVLAALEVLEN
jgi:aspartate aminotransferase-like enzyme